MKLQSIPITDIILNSSPKFLIRYYSNLGRFIAIWQKKSNNEWKSVSVSKGRMEKLESLLYLPLSKREQIMKEVLTGGIQSKELVTGE